MLSYLKLLVFAAWSPAGGIVTLARIVIEKAASDALQQQLGGFNVAQVLLVWNEMEWSKALARQTIEYNFLGHYLPSSHRNRAAP